MKALRITVIGTVQGVNFRNSAQRKADELGIYGYVKNLENGAVEIVAQGIDDAMTEFLGWVKIGPSAASVSRVTTEVLATNDYSDFQVIR